MSREKVKNATGIWRVGPDKYLIEVSQGKDPVTGKYTPYTETLVGSVRDAKARRAELVVRLGRAGRLQRRSESMTLGEYMTTYIKERRPSLAARTYERYDSLARTSLVPRLGAIRLCDLTEQHIIRYVVESCGEMSTHRKDSLIAPKTVHNRFLLLQLVLDEAWQDGLIPSNPARRNRVKNRLPKCTRFEGFSARVGDVEHLAQTINDEQLAVMVHLAAHTGMRLGEILALTWRDVDLTAGLITVRHTIVEHLSAKDGDQWWDFKEPKSRSSRREIELSEETVERLKEYRDGRKIVHFGSDFLFAHDRGYKTASAGEPFRPTTISRRFRREAKNAGLEGLRFHDLRHHHATVLRDGGNSERDIAERLGHGDAATTSKLYGETPSGRRKALAVSYEAAYKKAQGA